MNSLLVGLDVGTSSSKAVVFDIGGRPVSEGKSATPWTPSSRGLEMDPDALTASAVEALRQALAGAPDGQVLGLGVTGMGESGVLLDARGAALAPVIAWHDTRDSAEVADLEARIGTDRFVRTTGLPLRGQWSLTKHRWLVEHQPHVKEAVRRLNIAEWIVRSLGGEEAAEQSLASRTGWLQLSERQWWPEALDWSGARASLMPDLVTAGTPLGAVAAGAGPDRLTGAVMTVAGHDHQAATIGAGASGAGDELDSCGSAEALIRTIPAGLDPDSVAVLAAAGITTGWHVLADRWCLLGGTQGGLALQGVLQSLGVSREQLPGLDAQALAGRTAAAGTGAQPADVWRAALEEVTEEARTIHAAMSAAAGHSHSLVVTGGWTHSQGLLETKRRLLGPLTIAPVTEAGARGAALLAGVAAGVYPSAEDLPALEREPHDVGATS
jgi:sugar (pentulose or hexulose) kinase